MKFVLRIAQVTVDPRACRLQHMVLRVVEDVELIADTVWWRRVSYYVTLSVTAVLIVFGLALAWADRSVGQRKVEGYGVRDAVVVGAAQVAVGTLAGLYTGRWRRGSFEEAYAVALTVGATGMVGTALNLAREHWRCSFGSRIQRSDERIVQ